MMSMIRKMSLSIIALLLLSLPATVLAETDQSPTLEEIRQGIAEQGATWEARETSVMKLSPEDRRRLCGAQLVRPNPEDIVPPPFYHPQAATITHWDWRDHDGHNWVTPVRDQGGCGSCVVFGCTAAFEAAMSIYFDAPEPTFDLSEQHVFSCGGGSCEYGWNVATCLNYIRELGSPDESCYPYLALDDQPPAYGAPCGESCADWAQRARKISSWGWAENSEQAIKNALMNSPLPVYLTVYSDFFAYSSGVYVRTSENVEGGHIVCMVGWDDDLNCWICKNSWGDWGEDGYFRIRKGTNEADIEASIAWLIPEPAEYPSLWFHAYEIADSLGDNDGVLNPGETARLRVGLYNQQTWAAATMVSGILSSVDPRVTVHDLLSVFDQDVPSGQTIWERTDEFTITVEEDIGVCDIPLSIELSATSGKLPAYNTIVDFDLAVTYDQYGWPVELGSSVRSSPLLEDLDGDDTREVVVTEYQGMLHVWDQDGLEQPGFPVTVPGDIWGSPAVADLDGNGQLDIVFGCANDTVYAFTNTGAMLFSRGLGGPVLATPALADLDGDNRLETIVGALDGTLAVLKDDGTDYDRFSINKSGPIFTGAAVADLDGDGALDIVWGSSDKNVYAVSTATGEALDAFPVSVGGMVVSAPSVANIDEDSYNEVLFGCDDGRLYVVDPLGGVQFSVASGQMVRTSPAVGDVDGDGSLDIVFASKSGQVYALDGAGNILSGWPFQAGGYVESSPVLVDMNGDGVLEVVFGTANERLHMVSGDGVVLEEYPTPPTGAVSSTAAVGDLDGDGDFEVLLGTPSGLSVWDYKLPAGSSQPWPMYRGNCRRTGYYGDGVATGAAQEVVRGELPESYSLSPNYPNPFNAQTQIEYVLPRAGRVRLEVYNILGQRVSILVDGDREAGSYVVSWDGVDELGNAVASGVYFYRMRVGDYRETRRMVLLR
jgi:C1A family cysteine protease